MVARWDGRAFLRVVEAAAARLQREAAEVDALNVYPLPDGDTGRNMYQTMAAALTRARGTGPSLREVSAALAQGGLMGARGNSGVILSQMLRGFRDAFASVDTAGPDELREAFKRARENAFAAVDKPADGTMLSLCAAVTERTPTDADMDEVLRAAVGVGKEALDRTMEDNPLNRAAGVVDAGAYGVWLLLVGALGAVAGEAEAEAIAPLRLRKPGAKGAAGMVTDVASWTGGHCVQYLISSPRRKAEDLRREMVEAGADSVLVVGDESLMKVHAHAAKPETIVAIGESAGETTDLVVEDFDEMVAEHERATGIVLRSPPRKLATIAVVPGDGFAEIARSLYATPLLGGATMNPSVGELIKAIDDANAEEVVILPNDKNVVLAARQAAAQVTGTKVDVLETKSVAHGMAALVAFDPMRPRDEVVAGMREAFEAAHGIEVTLATRAASIDGISVQAGDAVALLDGRLVARGADPVEAMAEAAGRLEGVGIVTLYCGADCAEEDADRAASRLREVLPDAELEVRRGGQPHYPFIVQAE